MSGFVRNRCPASSGIGVRLRPEYAVSLSVILGFSTADWNDFLGSSADFGEVTVGVDGSESVVTNVLLVDPEEPHGELPFAFGSTHPLWLRIKTGGAGILFTGAKLGYRRRLVVV